MLNGCIASDVQPGWQTVQYLLDILAEERLLLPDTPIGRGSGASAEAIAIAVERATTTLERRADSLNERLFTVQEQLYAARGEGRSLRAQLAQWIKCAEYGWTVIANAGGGNWERESADWQEAAARFRDECYYSCLSLREKPPSGTPNKFQDSQ
jgi:hypothetical protein